MKKKRPLLDKFASRLSGAVDEAVLGALRSPFGRLRPRTHRESHPVDRRALLAEAIAFYRQPERLAGEAFFLSPPSPRVHADRKGALDGGAIFQLSWQSNYEPAWARARADFLSYAANRTAHARLYAHERPRATVVCLHGYRGGAFFIEERSFQARWLYRLGLDVVLFTLPFHGLRSEAGAHPWPSANVGRMNEGFGQVVFDLRSLMSWLRERGEDWPLILCGMSLGGYTSALMATLEPLAFVAPMIPVGSFADLMWAHAEGRPERVRAEREGITLELLRQATEIHAPLSRRPLVPPERMLVMSAAGDRIAPPEHAAWLARHFGAEELRFAGGHVLQLGRADAFGALARRLSALGLIASREEGARSS